MKQLLMLTVLILASQFAMAKTFLIDVRTPEEFSAGHLNGAVNIEYQVIGSKIATIGAAKDDTVILYCRSGHRAGIALKTLSGMGYKDARNYGGIEDARKKLEVR